MKLTGKKLLLLFLYSPVEHSSYNFPISGRTRLMKMGFLFKEELKTDFEKDKNIEFNLPEYSAWHYGPFSRDLLCDLDFLHNQGYVKISSGTDAPTREELAEYEYWIENVDDFEASEYQEEVFSLSENLGIPKGKELWEQLSENQKKALISFKTTLTRASLNRILEYVYKKYREQGFVDKSLIRERYLH